MKNLWIWIFLACFTGHAEAQSDTADERASCQASFHEGCKSDSASSDGFAAPGGVLGSTVLEGGLVVLLIAGGVARRLGRHAAGGGRKAPRSG